MAKKALSINFPVERAVLSDVLPFEVPIVFSNRHFYKFLCEHGVKYSNFTFSWFAKDDALDELVKLVVGVSIEKEISRVDRSGVLYSTMVLEKREISSIPFAFSISHKEDQLRHLSLIHPRAQMLVVDFYDEFKDLIIYFSGRSEYSLRMPRRVAGCT